MHSHSEDWADMFARQQRATGIIKDIADSIDGHKLLISELLRRVPHGVIAEMGAGRGYVSLYFASLPNNYRVDAIDADPRASDALRSLASAINIPLHVITTNFIDQRNLGSYDAIFNSGVMEHFTLPKAMEIIGLWAQHTGLMLLSIPYQSTWSTLSQVHKPGSHGDECFYSLSEWRRAFADAGSLGIHLHNIVAYNHSWPLYNKIRKYVVRPGFKRIIDNILWPIDEWCGNEALFIIEGAVRHKK